MRPGYDTLHRMSERLLTQSPVDQPRNGTHTSAEPLTHFRQSNDVVP